MSSGGMLKALKADTSWHTQLGQQTTARNTQKRALGTARNRQANKMLECVKQDFPTRNYPLDSRLELLSYLKLRILL